MLLPLLRYKGFTVLELLVAVSIFGLLVVLAGALFSNVFVGSKQQFSALSNVDQARLVSSQFLNELRNATTGIDGSYALGQAGDTQIIFYSKKSDAGATINRIRYYLSGKVLYKGVVTPSGSPLFYNLASEVVRPIQSDVNNGAMPIFSYYDDNYDGSSSALAQPVNVTAVKFVKINLSVLTQVAAQSNTSFSINEGVALRNLKTNLGN